MMLSLHVSIPSRLESLHFRSWVPKFYKNSGKLANPPHPGVFAQFAGCRGCEFLLHVNLEPGQNKGF